MVKIMSSKYLIAETCESKIIIQGFLHQLFQQSIQQSMQLKLFILPAIWDFFNSTLSSYSFSSNMVAFFFRSVNYQTK